MALEMSIIIKWRDDWCYSAKQATWLGTISAEIELWLQDHAPDHILIRTEYGQIIKEIHFSDIDQATLFKLTWC
jgi:hypothetical protein